jgi:hypothetical protein
VFENQFRTAQKAQPDNAGWGRLESVFTESLVKQQLRVDEMPSQVVHIATAVA